MKNLKRRMDHPQKPKFLIIMKLMLAFLLFFTLNLSANSFGQERVNLQAKKMQISEVLNTIEHQTSYRFLYSNELADLKNKISINAKNASIDEVLSQMFFETSLTYTNMPDKLIVIKSDPMNKKDVRVTGSVMDEKGSPLGGVSVQVKGTNAGTVTDAQGKFSINVPNTNAILEISSVGFESQDFPINGQTEINIVLKSSQTTMDQVVVIGYGTSKKGDLTSSIATVRPEELQKTPSGALLNAVQGNVTGVQISSFGGPGDTPEINIRGIKSLYGGSILYVVDGIFVDNIDFLTPSDIQDFQILKDASSAAIYGYKASNGVIVITTKGGKFNRDATVSYSGYYGWQKATNVIKMANAEQFVTFANESGSNAEIASVQSAIARFGRSRVDPSLPDVNTDWYKEALRIAPIMSHNVSVDGGSQKISYSVGASYFTQDGILNMKNDYTRYNLRAKLEAKAKSWLTLGSGFVYSKSEQYDDSSPWQEIYYAVPILPVLDQNYAGNTQYSEPYSSAKDLGYRDHQNPFPNMYNIDRLGERRRTTVNVYGDFHIIPKILNFKTSLSYNNKSDNNRLMDLPYFISDAYQRSLANSSITRSNVLDENYTFDNTLTYTKIFGDHDVTAMGGFSFRDERFNYFSSTGFFYQGSPFSRDIKQTWYINNTTQSTRLTNDGNPSRAYSRSYFGRMQYKFKNKYIAYFTLRNEAANKYDQQLDITLPSVGAAWIVSQEEFLKNASSINFLKLRAGWGRLANGNIPTSRAKSATSIWSVFNDTRVDGFRFSTFEDNLGWEFNEEINVGVNLEMLSRRLSIDVDYFVKNTKNLAIPVLPQVGTEQSFRNVGSMRNKGIEITATWKGKISEDLGYTISGNYSTIKNEITDLAGQAFLNRGMAEFQQRLVVGQPFDVFYGWDIIGVYQNDAEVSADPVAVAANKAGAGTVKPGYFKFKDVNNDGILDAKDRIYLGSPIPTYYYGGSISLNYKQFDFSARIYGQGGNIILNRSRAEVFRTSGRNIDAQLADNRWHGEGTSNSYPSSTGYRTAWNQRNSRFWLEDGSFFRVQNVQLGYTIAKKARIPEMQITLTADRPFVWTKSKSTNVEVGFDGVDLDTYPMPSVFTIGWNVKF
ncbi:MAG TPA: TonB-dependent receptor [Niabella sp.]|nr:TonB-dependent receptor [Niabella sp.]HOZ98226.1 TonB-dependent receptor [Niabella sp.]HQW13214.1 TonB-dependent receptor [Niabella sp.]HQX18746.1 TonB-dependent receptor [Niabella sp.]HQX41632.1 TonB-dependent receptor [Niabella sp.]